MTNKHYEYHDIMKSMHLLSPFPSQDKTYTILRIKETHTQWFLFLFAVRNNADATNIKTHILFQAQ